MRRPLGATSCYSVSRTGGTVVVTIQGEIGLDDWADVDAALWDLIDAQGNLDVVLDLSEVGYLEREAVPLIVDAAGQAHSHGGHLAPGRPRLPRRRPRVESIAGGVRPRHRSPRGSRRSR